MQDIINLVQSKINGAQDMLDDLIHNYADVPDTKRLDTTNLVMNQVHSYIHIVANLLLPRVDANGRNGDIVARNRTIIDDIEQLSEHMLMMHVDEPDNEFFNDLKKLADRLARAKRTVVDTIVPWAESNLTEEESQALMTQVGDQMSHETGVSSQAAAVP